MFLQESDEKVLTSFRLQKQGVARCGRDRACGDGKADDFSGLNCGSKRYTKVPGVGG
jgi:hypothetical protein